MRSAVYPPLSSILAIAALSSTVPVGRGEPDAGIPAGEDNWPQFRGPRACGVAAGSAPTEWDVQSGKNVRWKTAIPGLGHSSPIIWGDRLFVTSAVSRETDPRLKVGLYGDITPVTEDSVHRFLLYCLDRNDGRILWEKTAHEGVPKIKRHPKATHANSTPATDGKHVVAFFGSEGLYGFDMDGNLLWQKDFGLLDSGYFVVPEAQWGFGSSPVIHDNMVIVQCDVQKDSFLAALDIRTGERIWRTARNEIPTWGTPTVYDADGRTQVIVNGFKHIGGYDARTGGELWRLKGGGDIPVPTPIVGDGLIFITNAHGGQAPIYAVRTTARGDITPGSGESAEKHLAWSDRRAGNYMQTPILYNGLLFGCRDNGVLSVFEPASGRRLHQMRLGSGRQGFTASPVAADDKLYFAGEDGEVFVVTATTEPRVVTVNPMGEPCMATPAIADGTLYVRTQRHLYAIGPGR